LRRSNDNTQPETKASFGFVGFTVSTSAHDAK
jgi:hypothetical protein